MGKNAPMPRLQGELALRRRSPDRTIGQMLPVGNGVTIS